jgi:molybdate transport system substrate-binding protein
LPIFRVLLMLCAVCLAPAVVAGEVKVAVAANFAPTLERLAEDFTAQTGHRVVVSSASTGKHFAQIRNGAAFDVFLAADAERPARLERLGLGVTGSRFTYAQGRLVLWVPGAPPLDEPSHYLAEGGFERLAIANPRLAPYGAAARQVLERWGLWEGLRGRLVSGENVAQALQFVATGNAQAGLVALAQVLLLSPDLRDAYRLIPAELHAPIEQQALLLRPGAPAEAFLGYLRGERAAAQILQAGYAVPGRS